MRRNHGRGAIAAALLACAAKAGIAGTEGSILLAASAADVQAIVVRDDTGRVQRYSKGDAVGDSDWRLVSVQRDGADFESISPRGGVPTRMHVAAGARMRLRLPSTTELPPVPVGHAQPASTEQRSR
jgi:hypothetical protein